MKFKAILFLIIIPFFKVFSQDKTIINFETAIKEGYINSPTLIPITVSNNNERKYFLSDTETLYYVTQIEYKQENSDSLKSIILRNSKTQNFTFNNPKALELIGFYKRKNIQNDELLRIYNFIRRKKIIPGLIELSKQQKNNSNAYNKYYSKRLIIKDNIIQNHKGLNENEKKFLENLATNIITDDEDIRNMGGLAQFNTAYQILNLWYKNIKNEKEDYKNLEILEAKLITKYITIPKKKFGSNYFLALFKYGVSFYVSDLDGTTHFGGIRE
ncbi:MAG: hypothetical protein BGO86_01920 [Chryseobacterium sp. 36-9]|nr:MAG: hypothetical protein BGO86_01920 [Chryseobacterium sp. 36-9]